MAQIRKKTNMRHYTTDSQHKLENMETAKFLVLLDEDNDQYTFETIEEPKPADRPPEIRRYNGSFDEHKETLAHANQSGCGVFVTINATDGKGRKKENIVRVRALFVDLDGSPLNPILQAPLEPHIIIESSPGRYHAYWLIEDIPLEHFESAQKFLAKKFDGDPSVCDLPRLMRLPGFLHRKGEPFRSRIVQTSATLSYCFKIFKEKFKWDPKEQATASCNADSEILTILNKRGLLRAEEESGTGRWRIRCPWAHEHTNGDDAYYFSKPCPEYPRGGFKCFHAHCKHRDLRALRAFLGLAPVEGLEPLPLFREVPPSKTYPIEALGPVLAQAAQELYDTIKAPIAIIAQSLLGAASLVTQPHANVETEDGRQVALSLFLITVAESGERKSAIDDVVLSAVLEWQSSLWNCYRNDLQKYRENLFAWNESKKNKNRSENIEYQPEPEPPIKPIIIVEEPTYEGLVKYLDRGQPSVGLFSDEGGRFFGGSGMNRDNLLKTLAGLSSLWDAKPNKPITRMRSSDESLALYGRRCALHMMIQESVYSMLNEVSLCETQGFLPRCLVSFPESAAGSRLYANQNPRMLPGVLRFKDHCNRLLDSKYPIALPPAPSNQLEPHTIRLSLEAHQCWISFHDRLEKQLGKGGEYHSVRRFGSKAAEHVLRVAGVLALFEDPSLINPPTASCEELNPKRLKIGVDYVERAITIIDYYLHERIRLDNYCYIEPNLLAAQKVLEWMKNKGSDAVTLRDLYQYGPSTVRSKNKAVTVMRILEDHGRAYPIPANEIIEGAKGKAWRIIQINL